MFNHASTPGSTPLATVHSGLIGEWVGLPSCWRWSSTPTPTRLHYSLFLATRSSEPWAEFGWVALKLKQEQPQQINYVQTNGKNRKYKDFKTSDEDGTTKKVRFKKPSKFLKDKKTSESKNNKNYKRKICINCYKRNLPERVYKSHDDSECTRINKKKSERVNMVNHENSHEPDPIFSDEEFAGMINEQTDIERKLLIFDTGATTNSYNNTMPLIHVQRKRVTSSFDFFEKVGIGWPPVLIIFLENSSRI